MDFIKRLNDPSPLLLDGATGTLVFQYLPGYSGCIELLNLERPDIVTRVHEAYAASGADIIETNTFGGSVIKLEEYGLGSRCAEINRKAAELALRAAKSGNIFVAGSIGPTGKLLEPMGDLGVAAAYDAFFTQAKALAEGGVDLFIIETMSDLLEAKTALLAARDAANLPVICSMTFEESGKTVSGTDIITGLSTLSQCGAAAVGMNCSMGPEGLLRLYEENIERLHELGVPLSAWANAGLPEFIDGKAVYAFPADRFAGISARIAGLGVRVIGGCCGTSPAHITELRKRLDMQQPLERSFKKSYSFLTGRFSHLNLAHHCGLIVIGERLNPTARKKFAEELKSGQHVFLREESRKQEDEGAHVLDINVGVPGIDEIAAIRESVTLLSSIVKTPLMIDSDNPEVIETALRSYPGVGIVNSINGKSGSMEKILPLLRRYGCFIVALCLDGSGIHLKASRRIEIGEEIIRKLADEGISSERVFIDPLMLAESAEPGAAMETLKVIEHFAGKGIKTSLGISNISFGLPARKYVNAAFLKLAVGKGLSAAIVNPVIMHTLNDFPAEEKTALDFLTGKDPGAARYIAAFKEEKTSPGHAPALKAPAEKDALGRIYAMVVDGNNDEIAGAVTAALDAWPPETIMNDALLGALERVGELYSSGEYFLPQMIASASSMKKGFAVLQPLLAKTANASLGTVVICTVKGDVHDIGKNIVAMMLENHGFRVHDLGKDVPTETVMQALRDFRPDILALSSLLTTTMNEMKNIAGLIVTGKLPVKLLIGGAVVNEEYARGIGAWYGQDAVEGVKAAKELIKGRIG